MEETETTHARRGIVGWLIAAVAALAILFVLAWIGMTWFGGPPMMYYYGYPRPSWFFFPFGFLFFLLIGFLVFRLLFWRSWGWGYWGRRGYYGMNAKDILKRRYARGEINKDQFEQMLRDIEQHP